MHPHKQRYRSRPPLYLPWIILLLANTTQGAGAQEATGIARFFSNSIRQTEARLAAIDEELDSLPAIPSQSHGGTFGFHGIGSWEGGQWVMVDLGILRPIDAVVLVPVNIAYGQGGPSDYGFPVGLRIEVSDSASFTDARTVANTEQQPLASAIPAAIFDTGGVEGRYVRVTAKRQWAREGRPIFALAEMLVFSGGRNVAPGKTVTTSDSIEAKPLWSTENLVDAQSMLGSAVAPEHALFNGYHSEIESSPLIEKWVQIDLGALTAIDEIRVLPARPYNWIESHGFGFPRRFRIESSTTEQFGAPRLHFDRNDNAFPNPGNNPIVIPLDQVEARYVRFTATELWKRESDFVFALAELQVFSGRENVALGKTVSALDLVDQESWSNEALVDGFDSRNRLENDELGWLKGIVRRSRLEEERTTQERHLIDIIGTVTTRLVWLSIAIGVGLAAFAGLAFVRSKRARLRDTARLRERIASDLHDEIGSNLGSIALLSEIGSKGEDLAEINRVARETAASMQDIAWVIGVGHDTLEDLVLRMREVAAAMLRKVDYTIEVTPEEIPSRRISLNFKRNTLLFFKEALHNLTRHSQATRATIVIKFSSDGCRLQINDNGRGFDKSSLIADSGSGMKNMRKRAESLDGETSIESAPGEGTQIEFRAPYH